MTEKTFPRGSAGRHYRIGIAMFDVCVIGHVTRDKVRIGDAERVLPGGVACYSSVALQSLGARVCLVTKCAEKDNKLLDDAVKKNIAIFHRPSEETTNFENIYHEDLSSRRQIVRLLAEPFSPQDIPHISTRLFHVGPLTENDIPLEILKGLSQKSKVSLDVQGYLRRVEKGRIRSIDWEQKDEGLSCVQILKADEAEMKILSGERDVQQAAVKLSTYGIDEIIVTRGNKGSVIYANGKFCSIPSFAPKNIVDATGCGDTYMAGYIFKRLKFCAVEEAGSFAAAIASLKLQGYGPFTGTERDVQRFLEGSSGEEGSH